MINDDIDKIVSICISFKYIWLLYIYNIGINYKIQWRLIEIAELLLLFIINWMLIVRWVLINN